MNNDTMIVFSSNETQTLVQKENDVKHRKQTFSLELISGNLYLISKSEVSCIHFSWRHGIYFVSVAQTLLRNKSARNYVGLINNMLKQYERIGFWMFFKMKFLHSNLDIFQRIFVPLDDESFHSDGMNKNNLHLKRLDVYEIHLYLWKPIYNKCTGREIERFIIKTYAHNESTQTHLKWKWGSKACWRIMADFCWFLQREYSTNHKSKIECLKHF